MPASGRIAIIGSSLAAINTIKGLRRGGFDGPVTLIGQEHEPPYDRPPLSKSYLTDEEPRPKPLARGDLLEDVDLRLGVAATQLRLRERRVELADGRSVQAEHFVIATGSRPRVLPALEHDDRVHVVRTRADAHALRTALAGARHVVIVGAGFLGCEIATSARQRGLEVTVVEAAPAPLTRSLGAVVGRALATWHTQAGVTVLLDTAVTGTDAGGVVLGDGTRLPADVIVVTIGATPDVDWLAGSGLVLGDGLVCDEHCRVAGGDGHVWAAGDVASWPSTLFGERLRVEHWTNAVEQGAGVAESLLHGDAAPLFDPVPYVWSDQQGRKLQILGCPDAADEIEVVDGALDGEAFIVAWTRSGVLRGAALVGRPLELARYEELLRTRGTLAHAA